MTGNSGNQGITLPSDLWFDQPDAHNYIDKQYRKENISATQADKLQTFVDEGYLIISLDLDPQIFNDL